MENEKKERDFVENVNVDVMSVEVQTSMMDSTEVKKVVFETSKGRISYKPKIAKQEYRDGLKIGTIVSPKVDELPQLIRDIGKHVQNKGKCTVNVAYNVWNTEKDGEPVTYRYVQGSTMLDKWVIVKETISEEVVQ